MKETARGPATGKRREIVRGNVREKEIVSEKGIGSGTQGTERGTESAIGRRRRRDTEILLARNETARDTETESVSVRERAQPRAGRGTAIESESRNAIEQRTRREIANAYALETESANANAKAMMSGVGRRMARNERDLQV